MILLLALPLAFLLGSILTILWFGNAIDRTAREYEERGREIERNRFAHHNYIADWE